MLYPYVVEGGFTVVSKTPATGLYDAHFGMVLTNEPHPCLAGYEGTDRRSPLDGSNVPMNEGAGCTAGPGETNARGAQNIPAPRAATGWGPADLAYDPESGKVSWDRDEVQRPPRDPVAGRPARLGEETGSGSTSSRCWAAADLGAAGSLIPAGHGRVADRAH